MASANALLLRSLLDQGCRIHFFSKASFVDPRPSAGGHLFFRFTDVCNRLTDAVRARTQGIPLLSIGTRMVDVSRYNRMVIEAIKREHGRSRFDVCLWMGDYARGRISGLPTVSFAQGAPGTDARSVLRRSAEIRRLSGRTAAWKWRMLARLRLSRPGLPRFDYSDLVIVGSSQSRRTLQREFGLAESRSASLPYPIDLETFRPAACANRRGRKRCLWLGRIVPRKRLDLFLDGIALAIRNGTDLDATVVGKVGFVAGYEKLIAAFPFPDRLKWIPAVSRSEVPELLRGHDVLIQPSEEEDFGSSVAEAQACGLPVIVGSTNGNGDYLCPSDIRLRDDEPQELARALESIARAPHLPGISRAFASAAFDRITITNRLIELIRGVVRPRQENLP